MKSNFILEISVIRNRYFFPIHLMLALSSTLCLLYMIVMILFNFFCIVSIEEKKNFYKKDLLYIMCVMKKSCINSVTAINRTISNKIHLNVCIH